MNDDGEYKFWRDWMWNDLVFPKSSWALLIFYIVCMSFVVWHVAVYG